MKKKIFIFFMMMTALFCFSSTGMAMNYEEAYESISAQFNSSSSSLGNYDALKAQLPDVSGNFNIMSQSDIDNVMNSYSAEIQGKYQSSISTAQANAQSSSAEAMANISARAKSIQNGVDPDTGEAYSNYIASHTPAYDADAWLANATANLSSNISTLRGIVGDAEMPDNPLLAGVQDQYDAAFDNYTALVADYEASKTNTVSGEMQDFITVHFGDDATDEQIAATTGIYAASDQAKNADFWYNNYDTEHLNYMSNFIESYAGKNWEIGDDTWCDAVGANPDYMTMDLSNIDSSLLKENSHVK